MRSVETVAGRPKGRAPNGEAPVRSLADQSRHGVALHQDLAVEEVDLALRLGHAAAGLGEFAARLQAVGQPLSHEGEGLAPDAHRLGGGVAIIVEADAKPVPDQA